VCGYPANLYCKLTTGEMFVETRVEHVSCGGEGAEGITDTYLWNGGGERTEFKVKSSSQKILSLFRNKGKRNCFIRLLQDIVLINASGLHFSTLRSHH